MFVLIGFGQNKKPNNEFILKNKDKDQLKLTVCSGCGIPPKLVYEISWRQGNDGQFLCFMWVNTNVEDMNVYEQILGYVRKATEFIKTNTELN